MGEPDHLSVNYRKKALPLSLTRRILRREQRRIFQRFVEIVCPSEDMAVLDLGVNGSLDRPEAYFFEFLYPYRERIVAAGLEGSERFRACFDEIPYVQVQRGSRLPFEDDAFDLVFCNAVVEHVGSRERQKEFLQEVSRVGRTAFITTPNRWYPFDLHTVTPILHWLPPAIHRPIYRMVGFEFFSREENLNLLDRRALASIVPAGTRAEFFAYRYWGLISNWILWMRRT